MQLGNWIPISKAFLKDLPVDRPYTGLEAIYSLAIDYDNKKEVTVTGYMNLWRWSKGKVLRFFKRVGVEILYPENTRKKRNQTGLITIHKPDLKRTNNGLKRMIDSKWLANEPDIKRTKSGLKTDLSRYTTIDPNPKTDPDPDNNCSFGNEHVSPDQPEKEFYLSSKGKELTDITLKRFNTFWEAFDHRKGKAKAADSWLAIKDMSEPLFNEIIEAAKKYAVHRKNIKPESWKWAQGWLSGRRWEDEMSEEKGNEQFSNPDYYTK